jgi:hypothetical protein
MDRPSLRYRLPLALYCFLITVFASGGCVSGLATLAYLIKGTNVDAEYKGLKGKTVAVIVRPVVDLQYSNPNATIELGQAITADLRKNVPKIKVIEQQKVNEWCDENPPDDYIALGKGLKADMVVAVELGGFSLLQGANIYQGRAVASLQVFDCRDAEKKAKDKDAKKYDKGDGSNIVFEKSLPEYKYPPAGGLPTSERQEPDFRQEYIKELADYIARHFYEHDSHADFAKDSMTLQ